MSSYINLLHVPSLGVKNEILSFFKVQYMIWYSTVQNITSYYDREEKRNLFRRQNRMAIVAAATTLSKLQSNLSTHRVTYDNLRPRPAFSLHQIGQIFGRRFNIVRRIQFSLRRFPVVPHIQHHRPPICTERKSIYDNSIQSYKKKKRNTRVEREVLVEGEELEREAKRLREKERQFLEDPKKPWMKTAVEV